MRSLARNLNALSILVLSLILFGAYIFQFYYKEIPCPLCMLQRLGMIGVACGELLNFKFGIQVKHYALSLLSAIFGGAVALRQICLHICPGEKPFGTPVFGLSLYTWSFLAFASVIFSIALLLILYDPKWEHTERSKLNLLAKVSAIFIFVVTAANVVTTFLECENILCSG